MNDIPTYLTENRVSKITGFALSTLRNKRFAGEGIPYCKIGRSVRYRLSDVVEFMNSHRIETAGCITE
ncbi:helix-turn-helix transcriptional regulator [Candidatus Omnitrophota bacterium]